jgi:hypothetical protein
MEVTIMDIDLKGLEGAVKSVEESIGKATNGADKAPPSPPTLSQMLIDLMLKMLKYQFEIILELFRVLGRLKK